ncbi:UNVERIFIED_CONTAM: hypothetical protein RMT77_005400 [Armadillidium vulgare]|nr:hypothetical protein Avbf_05066 [Armadillidium vulgare]RXG67813.1 hypothetical protein Avbf_18137 [Armadillidium vulgare]
MEDTPFRSRAQGAVDSERMQLLSIIAHHWDELERYEYGGGTQKQKWDLWDEIGKEFNSHPSVTITRTPLQIKTLFKNMKTKAKKYKLKLESCKVSGVIMESDIVSETVLQLTKNQSKESLKTLLESLKNIKYFDPKTNMPLPVETVESRIEIENSYELSESPSDDWQNMTTEVEDVPDIKEEVIEAFDSPCIIREDQSPISFPANEENSSDGNMSDNNIGQTLPETSSSPSEVHIGDLSVTPLSSGRKSPLNGLKIVSPISLGIPVHTLEESSTSLIPDHNSDNADNNSLSNRIILQPKTLLNTPISVLNLSNLIEKDAKKSRLSENLLYTKINFNSSLNSFADKNKDKTCCCPDYHNQMLNLAQKEHELTLSLINEKILAKREERRLHEEERKFREQNFLLKQEERRASLAEHQARMRLLELECKATQKRCKVNEWTSKWILRNGSKEI